MVKGQCGKFVLRGGEIPRALSILSIYLLLNFRNLPRALCKLSSQGKGGGGVEPAYSKSIPPTQTVKIEIISNQNFSGVYLEVFAHFQNL